MLRKGTSVAIEALSAGVEILQPFLRAHGFVFQQGVAGRGSGGEFASGEFVKGSRSLRIHFRYSLGMVTYHLDSLSIDHARFMALLTAAAHYPGFSSDPLDGFRHLLQDLEENGNLFLSGDDEGLRTFIESASRLEPKCGLPA